MFTRSSVLCGLKIDAHTVQLRLKFDFSLFIYNSLNFFEFLQKSFSIDVNGQWLPKNCHKNLANFLKVCSFEMHE